MPSTQRINQEPHAAAYNRPVEYPWVLYTDGRIFGSYRTREEAERVAATLSSYAMQREG